MGGGAVCNEEEGSNRITMLFLHLTEQGPKKTHDGVTVYRHLHYIVISPNPSKPV